MTQTSTVDRLVVRAIGYAVGFAVLWAVLAAIRPSTTYHLAPLLVSLIPSVVYRTQGGRSRSVGVWLAIAGWGMAVAVTALLAVAGLLDGPSLLPFGDGIVESLVGATAGGAVGLALVLWPQPARTT